MPRINILREGDTIDTKSGVLTVIRDYRAANSNRALKLKCHCGNIFNTYKQNIRRGATSSCGCYNLSVLKGHKRAIRHGHTKEGWCSKTYSSWRSMKARCNNPRNASYSRYGERGIIVCDRWLHSFESFLEDMGERPEGHSIDRIDNNGNYEPSNCKWSTPKEQCSNKSNTPLS